MPYTPGSIVVRAVMQAMTGLPADEVMNQFAFEFGSGPTQVQIDKAIAAVDNFYRQPTPQGPAVGEYISNYVNRAATHELQVYRIVAGNLGSPIYTEPWLGPPAALPGDGLPAEVAACLSFHAVLTGVLEEVGNIRPRGRRRGRVYIGPLIDATVAGANPPYRLGIDFLTVVRQAASRMRTVDAPEWSVWSPADEQLRPVVGGWTDNAPDTQRRRGPKASARVSWT